MNTEKVTDSISIMADWHDRLHGVSAAREYLALASRAIREAGKDCDYEWSSRGIGRDIEELDSRASALAEWMECELDDEEGRYL